MSAKALMFQILDWLLTSQTKGRPDSDSLDCVPSHVLIITELVEKFPVSCRIQRYIAVKITVLWVMMPHHSVSSD